jgi:hypothetical protein
MDLGTVVKYVTYCMCLFVGLFLSIPQVTKKE